MAAERSLRFDLIARDKSFSKTLDNAGRKGQRLNRQLSSTLGGAGDQAGRRFSLGLNKRLGGGFAAAARMTTRAVGVIGAAFAGVQVVGWLKGAIDEAREAAKIGRQTAAVIKATGGAANVTAKDVDRLAGSLMRKVAVDDDIIATGANMLLTFKGVRNEVGQGNRIFDQATAAAVDMTAAMNKGEVTQEGLQASSIRLGRALNDPIKGVTALTRVGVTFTEKQKEQIKTLVEAGDTMGAQKVILAELKSEFGGAAKAAVDPWQRVKVVMGEVKEQIGTALLPVLDRVANWLAVAIPKAIESLTGALQTAQRWWSDNRYEIDLIVRSLSTGFSPAADEAADSTRDVGNALSGLYSILAGIAEGVARLSQGYNLLIIASQSVSWFTGNLVQAFGHAINAADTFRKFMGFAADTTGHAGDAVVAMGRELEGKALNAINNARTGIDQASIAIDGLRTHTADAARAANDHATALRNQTAALDTLKTALRGEEAAELDVRQAKLHVQTAQKRLNDLKAAGKKGSIEYKQAQIDLERAQGELRKKTDEYRGAVARSTDAERTAASATTRAGDAAKTSGKKASDAKIPWAKLGETIKGIPANKRINVTVEGAIHWDKNAALLKELTGNFTHKLPAFAEGGRITKGTGPKADDVLIRASKGETVVPADDSQDPGFQRWAAAKGIPGFQRGGVVQKIRPFHTANTDALRYATRAGLDSINSLRVRNLGGGSAKIKAFIRSLDPLPYIWGGGGPGGYDCSGITGAVALAMRGKPYGHGQRVWTTSSIRPGILGLKSGLGGVHQIGVTAGTGHMSGMYGGLKYEARSTRSGILVGSAARHPASFARKFHMARGGKVDAELVNAFARIGADIGGDAGKLRINGLTFARGGHLSPRAFSYAKHLLQRIRSGARVSEDFTWRGMPRNYGRWNDDVMRLVLPQIHGRYDFPRDLRKVSPILGRLIHRSAYRAGLLSTSRKPVDWGTVSQATWHRLLTAGWRGRAGDQAERLYPPRSFDSGGWLMPGEIGVNRTSQPERVLAPGQSGIGRREARMIAEELAGTLRAAPLAVYMDGQKVDARLRTAAQWNERRR